MFTLGPQPYLDYRYQVFGRVRASSWPLIDYIEFFAGTNAWDKMEAPLYNVNIINCYLTAP